MRPTTTETIRDVVIIGAGPNGISCAVHAQQAGLRVIVLERGRTTDSFRRYPVEMRFSSTRANVRGIIASGRTSVSSRGCLTGRVT
jgi:thioredoxin reductase